MRGRGRMTARVRGEQDQPRGRGAAPRLEGLPALMAYDVHPIEIVHAGPPEGAVGGGKARRFDDMRLDAETGGQTKNGPRVLGNIGLEQRNAQVWGQACSRSGRPNSERPRRHEESALPRPGILPGEQGPPCAGSGPSNRPRPGRKPARSKEVMRLLVIAVQASAFPTCAPLARVPIKRRWIKPLRLLLAT